MDRSVSDQIGSLSPYTSGEGCFEEVGREEVALLTQERRGTMMKRTIISILVLVLCSAVLAGVFYVDRKESAERSTRIAESNRLQEQEKSQIREEKKQIYTDLIASLQEAATSLVLWGDDYAVGNQYGNLAKSLEKVVADALFATIRKEFISSTMTLNTSAMKLVVTNMGATDEKLRSIMARTGAHQMLMAEDFIIPAGTEYANIELMDEEEQQLIFAVQPVTLFGPTVIQGVEGLIYTGDGYYDETHTKLAFGRDNNGQEVLAPRGTPIYTEGAEKYLSSIPVLFFAEDPDTPKRDFCNYMREIVSRYGDHQSFALIVTTDEDSIWNQVLTENFGDQYIQNTIDFAEMTESDFTDLAQKVYEVLDAQGVFEAVKAAVSVAQAKMPE